MGPSLSMIFAEKMKEESIAKNLTTNVINKHIHYMVVLRKDYIDDDYEDEYSSRLPALCVFIVSLIQVLFFISDHTKLNIMESIKGPIAFTFIHSSYHRYEFQRFLTYKFVRIGQKHLVYNLITRLLFGVSLEMEHWGWRVVIIYLSIVLAGSFAISITNLSTYLTGGVTLKLAHVTSMIINWSEMEFAVYRLLVLGYLITFYHGSYIFDSFYYYVKLHGQICYTAHRVGAFVGLLAVLKTLRNLQIFTRGKTFFLLCHLYDFYRCSFNVECF